MKKKNELRYIVTEVVSIPVVRIGNKKDAYRMATSPGWGVVEWYSAINDYKMPINRDTSDKTQVMYCDEDTSATLYSKYDMGFYMLPCEEINLKYAPSQAETKAIIISGADGYDIWMKEDTNIKIFVTHDENGLIDTYRFENWDGKPYEGEMEISFSDLQSEADYDTTYRADIVGTLENMRKMGA